MLYTHIWICGGPGWATTQVYPARFLPLVAFPAEDQHLKRITAHTKLDAAKPPAQSAMLTMRPSELRALGSTRLTDCCSELDQRGHRVAARRLRG